MVTSFGMFLKELSISPALLAAVLICVALMIVNGWTDAPNAIASCLSTRAMTPRQALGVAVVMNFLGVLMISIFSSVIALSAARIADFGGDKKETLSALIAGMAAAVLWSTLAGRGGLPTSKSHALFSGITGAAIALEGGLGAIHPGEWGKVLGGLLLSVGMGYGGGYLLSKLVEFLFRKIDRRGSAPFFRIGQIASGAAVAFLHGAQDGQKYMGVIILAIFLANGQDVPHDAVLPAWLMILASIAMAVGTSLGGFRIIRSIGFRLVKMEPYHGFSADVAAAISLLISTIAGFPVSTTHTKTAAIMGVGSSQGVRAVNWKMGGRILLMWLLTFPGCALLGYLLAMLTILLV